MIRQNFLAADESVASYILESIDQPQQKVWDLHVMNPFKEHIPYQPQTIFDGKEEEQSLYLNIITEPQNELSVSFQAFDKFAQDAYNNLYGISTINDEYLSYNRTDKIHKVDLTEQLTTSSIHLMNESKKLNNSEEIKEETIQAPIGTKADIKTKFVDELQFHFKVYESVRHYYKEHMDKLDNFVDLDPFLKTFLYINYEYISAYTDTIDVCALDTMETKWMHLYDPLDPDILTHRKLNHDTEDVMDIVEDGDEMNIEPPLLHVQTTSDDENARNKQLYMIQKGKHSNIQLYRIPIYGTGPPSPLYYYYEALDDIVFYYSRSALLLRREQERRNRIVKKQEGQIINLNDMFMTPADRSYVVRQLLELEKERPKEEMEKKEEIILPPPDKMEVETKIDSETKTFRIGVLVELMNVVLRYLAYQIYSWILKYYENVSNTDDVEDREFYFGFYKNMIRSLFNDVTKDTETLFKTRMAVYREKIRTIFTHPPVIRNQIKQEEDVMVFDYKEKLSTDFHEKAPLRLPQVHVLPFFILPENDIVTNGGVRRTYKFPDLDVVNGVQHFYMRAPSKEDLGGMRTMNKDAIRKMNNELFTTSPYVFTSEHEQVEYPTKRRPLE